MVVVGVMYFNATASQPNLGKKKKRWIFKENLLNFRRADTFLLFTLQPAFFFASTPLKLGPL